MERSRFDSPYTRRDRHSGADSREDSRTVDLFMKFRQFRPYLQVRLKKIHSDKREREFREEVDDIRYFLSVMSDMLADENHGAAALQGFIDRIHEMVRKNPLSENFSTHNEGDIEDDNDEGDTAPRSPSPTEPTSNTFSGPATTARTIPLERDDPDFNYFDSIEESIERGIHDRRKPAPTSRNPWDLENDPFNTLGPSQDIDMRSGLFKPMLNTTPMGQGAPRSSQYQENNNSNYRSTSFGRGVTRDENLYEWNKRHDAPSNSSNQGFPREGSFIDSKENPWRSDGFASFGRGHTVSSNDYNRAPAREPEYSSRDRDRQDYSRRRDRDHDYQYERGSSYSKDSGHGGGEREKHQRSRQEDSMFDRRSQSQQFERRRRPSNTSYEKDGSIHIDYHHGEEDQSWNIDNKVPSASTSSIDRDMRYPPPTSTTNPGIVYSQNAFDPNQQQMYLSNQQQNRNFGVNNFMQNQSLLGMPPPIVNPMMAGLATLNINSSIGSGLAPGPLTGFSHPPNAPPLRVTSGFVQPPIAAVVSTSVPYTSYHDRIPQTPKPVAESYQTDPENEERLKQLFKEKAQQAFGRNKPPRKENVHNSINNIVPPTPQTVSAPQKSPQGLLASNQMLSDRDPRLNRPQNKRPGFSTSQNDSQPRTKDTERRVELDPRLARRERERADHDHGGDRHGYDNKHRHSDPRRPDRHRDDRDSREKTGATAANNSSSGENRDRVARVNLDEPDTYSSSRRLDDTRNRVKGRLPTQTEQNKSGSKLQEIRKQVENERFHALGRPSSKKPSSFDEAIVVPLETPTRPHPKETSSSKVNQKSKEISKETDNSGSQKEMLKDKEKESQKEKSPSKSLRQKGRQRNISSGNEESDAGHKIRNRKKEKSKLNSKSGQKKAQSHSRSDSEPIKKSTSFRIPKIKKPDPPPPPPKSPSPEPVEAETPDLNNQEEVDTSVSSNKQTDANIPSTHENPEDEKWRLITNDIFRRFVLADMDTSMANSIMNNPEAISIIKERLQGQIIELLSKDESSTPQQTSTEQQEPETLREAEPETDIEPGGHRSRSVTKKRNTKRRSSLEKLHDALKEMRFDAMLPLGPRRCTLGQGEENQQSGSSSTTESKDAATSSPLSKKGSPKTTDVSKSANVNPSSSATDDTNATGDTALSSVGKKGTKRKRKASKVKPNKKKKGPVTRAQAAVKTAIKIQHKDKPGKKKRKNLSSPDETRVTRSMINGGAIKIKLEPVEVKEEPHDPSYEEIGQAADFEGMEYLVENNTQPETEEQLDTNISKATEDEGNSVPADLNMLMPTFNQDSFIDDEMSIDIKHEPEEMQIDIDEPDMESVKLEVDTDYNADLSDFLPDIPTMENDEDSNENNVYTAKSLEPETSTLDVILDQISAQSGREAPESRPYAVPQDCFDVIDSMLDEIDYLQDETTAELVITAITGDAISILDSTNNTVVVSDSAEESADDESEEPNDFFQSQSDDENYSQFDTSKQDEMSWTPAMSTQKASISTESQEPEKMDDINFELNMVKTEVFDEEPPVIKYELNASEEGFGIDERDKLSGFPCSREEEKLGDEERRPSLDSIPEMVIKRRMSQTDVEEVGEIFESESQQAIFLPNCDPSISDPEAESGRLTNLRGRLLYKCPNAQCGFQAPNASLLKDHLPSCQFTTDSKSFGCPHCDKRVKAVVNLMEHLKTHGQQKQICSLCTYKTWATSELTRHMKSFHKVYNHKAEKIENTDPDEDPALVIYPKDVASRISTCQDLKDSYACYADRLVFSPDDADKVPNRQIFQTLAHCSKCPYTSKVRINFIRHLQWHKEATDKPELLVPSSDPVNPVPCLERKELFFDKMTNWAGSSHENKQGNANSDSSGLPEFVSEQFRYVCSVKGCEQITVDEYMLRTHIKTLHSEVEHYNCPHCDKNAVSRSDKRHVVPIDRLGSHLKFHGRKLYRCAYCDVIHTQVVLMEKHLPEKHPERKPIHYLIRNLDSEGNAANRRNSNDDTTPTDTWRCTLCASKQLFPTYRDVKNHCSITHKVGSQFLCSECKYNTDDDTVISQHVLECAPTKKSKANDPRGKILIMWYRSEFNSKPEAVVHGPLWKRSTSSVKHIRGIFLEDVKEKAPRPEKQENISRQSLLSSEKIATPSIIGKTNRRPYKPPLNPPGGVKLPPPEKSFTCPKCNLFKTKSAANMRVHLYNEMGYQRYRCTKCNVKFVTESSLKGHMVGDHGTSLDETCFELLPVDMKIENYVNEFFSLEERKSASLEKSSLEIKSATDDADTSKQPVFNCKHCSQECQSAHNLKTHVLAKHIASERYSCGICKTTFWNQALVRNHHTRSHRDTSYCLVENFSLDLKPEFWLREYGLPLPPVVTEKKTLKRNSDGDTFSEPLPSTSDDISSRMPDLQMTEDDRLLFDFANCDTDPALIDDVRLALSSNGTTDDVLLQELFDDASTSTVVVASRTQNSNAFAYKCFHCGENSLSVRGARSHWEKVHSLRPEERCNYYEYKAFNENNQLHPCIQLTCTFCDFTTSCLDFIHDHHELEHPGNAFRMKRKLRVGFMVYECGECFHECCSVDHILEHISYAHSNVRQASYLTADLRDKMESNPQLFYGKLVEDTVHYACDDPICAFEFDTRAEGVNHMLADHGIISRRSNVKYNRHVINQRIRVPIDEEAVEPPKMGYQCPSCDFQAEDRQKLVTEHLGEHVHTYICPTCNKSFRRYVDTKFHIRLQHADPTGTPLINREMVKGREILENAIIKVKMPGRISS